MSEEVAIAVRTIPVEVVLLPERCFRCVHTTWPVVGLWFDRGTVNGDEYSMVEHDRGWFLQYDDTTADVIATVCADEMLAAHGSGPLRWTSTRHTPDRSLANTCVHCGSVLMNAPLHEALDEFLAEHGSLDDLPRIPRHLPIATRDNRDGHPPIEGSPSRRFDP
jgi:hypothetical protein